MFNRKRFLSLPYLLSTTYCLLFLIGCAGIPAKPQAPHYSIRGVNYLPLVPLCEANGISWDYDTFTRAVVLRRAQHKIDLRVGDTLVLVDGRPQHLREAVDIYQGAVVVPYRFEEQILDKILREPSSSRRPVSLPSLKIVLDAGHGGGDPGAIGRTGIKEKIINLDMAKRLQALLKSSGMQVTMTRNSDRAVSLQERVDIANRSKADLFVSMHSNSNRVRSLSGFEVYYITPRAGDSKRALESAQGAALDFDSSCFASQSRDLKAILWDMIYTYNRAESVALARAICQDVKNSSDVRILGIKGANFYVLKGVRFPAILVEIGFLSNREEERLLKNSYYRQQMAEAIAQGIVNYIREYERISEVCQR